MSSYLRNCMAGIGISDDMSLMESICAEEDLLSSAFSDNVNEDVLIFIAFSKCYGTTNVDRKRSIKKDKCKMIEYLLKKGVNPNHRDRFGRTALHIFCGAEVGDFFYGPMNAYGRSLFKSWVIACVKLLLQHGAEVDVVDDEGNVPIALARASGKQAVVELLTAHQKSR